MTDKMMMTDDEQQDHTYRIGTTEYARIRYGEEARGGGNWHISASTGQAQPCGDCAVPVGAYHQPGCDVEECPRCGGQSISCDCESETLPELQEAYERLLIENAALSALAPYYAATSCPFVAHTGCHVSSSDEGTQYYQHSDACPFGVLQTIERPTGRNDG